MMDLREAEFNLTVIGFTPDELGEVLDPRAPAPGGGGRSLAEQFMVPFSTLNARGKNVRLHGWGSVSSPSWAAMRQLMRPRLRPASMGRRLPAVVGP